MLGFSSPEAISTEMDYRYERINATYPKRRRFQGTYTRSGNSVGRLVGRLLPRPKTA